MFILHNRRLFLLFFSLIIALGAAAAYFGIEYHVSQENSSLFGIPLVPPTFAQSADPEFPDPEAGISAYVTIDPERMDFDKITPLFSHMIDAGDNYIIGAIKMRHFHYNVKERIHVRLYADNQGTLVAYIPKTEHTAAIFDWRSWDPSTSRVPTVLDRALQASTDAVGHTLAPSEISWYHWAHPTATHIAAAVRQGMGKLFIKIPEDATLVEQPSYSWDSQRNHKRSFRLIWEDGTTETLHGNCRCSAAVVAPLSSITAGQTYTIALQDTSGATDSLLGVVTIYAAP